MQRLPRISHKSLVVFHSILISLFLYLLNHYFASPAQPGLKPSSVPAQESVSAAKYQVVRIVDGDTFEIEGGAKVRLIGMNTPEIGRGSKKTECFAIEAKKELERLILGKTVDLVKDISETDKYGRLLRYVYQDKQFINDLLVREGFAQIDTYPPDVKFQKTFLESQRYARDHNLGLWSACPAK